MRILCILLLSALRIASLQSGEADVLSNANKAYSNRDFRTAQMLYETLVQSGARDPGLYYNLGNTYYEMSDLGRALLNYRRAQQFWPRDVELIRNLERVRGERVDLSGDEVGFAEGLTALTVGVLTLWELAFVVGLFWLAWFVALGLALWNMSWRKHLRLPLVVIGVILLMGVLLLAGRVFVTSQRPPAVVAALQVQVRSGPSEQYLVLYQLHAAAEVYIWVTHEGWVQFALPDGRLGWMPSEAVVIVRP